MAEFRHIYDLGGTVEQWERTVRERIERVMDDDQIESVSVDESTGIAEATLTNPTDEDLEDLDDELVYENVTRNPQNPAEVWVSFGSVVPAE